MHGPHVGTIGRWLTEDLDAPRKQRLTARQIWPRLLKEEDAAVAESSVRNLVGVLKADGTKAQVVVPQTHPIAEVDFAECSAVIARW